MRPHVSGSLTLAATFLLALPSEASAQRVGEGALVRLVHDCETPVANALFNPARCRRSRGSLAAVTADSLYLRDPVGAIARGSIRKLEVRSRGGRRLKYAGIGALCGVAVTAAVAVPQDLKCRDGPCGFATLILVPVGLVGGALVGALAGGAQWREVPPDSLQD